MKIHIFIIIALLVVSYADQLQNIINRLYHDDAQIQQITDNIIKEANAVNSQIQFKKETCVNDDSYHFISISNKEKQPSLQPFSVVITCNIHARELQASEICLRLLETLKDYIKNSKLIYPLLQFQSYFNKFKSPQNILPPHTQYRIFYRANNNREQSMKQDHCIRKNKNNIDENRSFPTQFGIQKTKPDSQIYGGATPISQQFGKCLNVQIQKKVPDLYLDIHTGQNAFFYQKDRRANAVQQDQQGEVKIINQIMKNKLCEQCRVTTLKKDNQTINGHIFADMKVRKNVKFSILFETFKGIKLPKGQQSSKKCFYDFNPATKQLLQLNTFKWTNIILQTVHEAYYLNQQQINKENTSLNSKVSTSPSAQQANKQSNSPKASEV